MSFKDWLNEVEDRGGGGNMRIPDGRPVGMRSGRSGEKSFTPAAPQTSAPNVQGDPKIPPSSFNPGSSIPKSKVPGGPFGGGGRSTGTNQPLQPSAFGGPMPPPNFTPTPSQFVNSPKVGSQQSHI